MRFFNTLIDDMKTKEKNTKLFCWYKNYQQWPKHSNIYETGLKTSNFTKTDSNTDVFLLFLRFFLLATNLH